MADRLPLFPLGTVLFPGVLLPLHIFEPRYRTLMTDLLAAPPPRTFGIVAIRSGHEVGADSIRALHDVGCVAEVVEVQPAPDGRFGLLVLGTRRFRLRLDDHGLDRSKPYLQGDVDLLDEPLGDSDSLDAAAASTRLAFAAYAEVLGRPIELPEDATELSYAVAVRSNVDLPERQALLAAPDTVHRLRAAAELLTRETAVMRNLRAVPMAPSPQIARDRLN